MIRQCHFFSWFTLFYFAIGCSGGGGSTSQTTPPKSPAATSTALVLSAQSVNAVTAITLTAAVTASGSAVTSGSLTFRDGSASLGTGSLDNSGKGTWSGSFSTIGTHTLTASYGGNSDYASSVSSAQTLTVTSQGLSSSVVVTASPSSAVQGLPVEFVATVAGSGTSTPTGTVQFSSGNTNLGAPTLDPTGVATFTSVLLSSGSDIVTATYSGDSAYASAVSQVSVNIGSTPANSYTNPLVLNVTGATRGVSCADPAILKTQNNGVNTWYLYCTSDALYAGDTVSHFISIYHSPDLVNWTYDRDAFAGLPSWANGNGAALWAPAIKYFNGQYYLYFATPATTLAGNGSAIGVGTSSSPDGPFVDSGAPVVEPELATVCCSESYRATIDPDVITDAGGQRYILFGSFSGGLYVRKLSSDGLTSDKSSEVQVAVDNRYEGGNWWFHDGFYYLFASATNCCNGPLTGYGVFVGRSAPPLGPYVDAQGIDMNAVNAGGTPVLAMNGNKVLGPGGNVMFTDEAGQDYVLYHGVLSTSPYYTNAVGYTARPAFIDAIDWIDGWPVTRGGYGPSDSAAPQPVPAAQPGDAGQYTLTRASQDRARTLIDTLSDDFNTSSLSSQWSFLHGTPTYTLGSDGYQVSSVAADPVSSMSSVPMLAEPAPTGDYMVETKLDLNLPTSGVGTDFAQAGILIYGDDNNFIRADLYNNNDTRQVEFIKAETPEASGYPTWGASDLGAPAVNSQITVWLRIVKRNVDGKFHYTAYTSTDGTTWVKGGTWVHLLGSGEKICLYAGNQPGVTGTFHYVHVSTLQ